jgi:exonuclease SbcC
MARVRVGLRKARFIAQFSALLRTLSKEHGRQILIAIHDRQLFEYLSLEMSPAFDGDRLITVELNQSPGRHSSVKVVKFAYRPEVALPTLAA